MSNITNLSNEQLTQLLYSLDNDDLVAACKSDLRIGSICRTDRNLLTRILLHLRIEFENSNLNLDQRNELLLQYVNEENLFNIQYLLSHGAEPFYNNNIIRTAMAKCSLQLVQLLDRYYDDSEIVESLIYGIGVNLNIEVTCLIRIMQYLFEQRGLRLTDPNLVLAAVVQSGSKVLLEYFLNVLQPTPRILNMGLYFTVLYNKTSLARMLLNNGADPNYLIQHDSSSTTPLKLSRRLGDERMTKLLSQYVEREESIEDLMNSMKLS